MSDDPSIERTPSISSGLRRPFGLWTRLNTLYMRRRLGSPDARSDSDSESLNNQSSVLGGPNAMDGGDDSSGEESVCAQRTGAMYAHPEEIIGTIREENDGLPPDAEFNPTLREVDGVREKYCGPCAKWISLGRSRISDWAYQVHIHSSKCARNALPTAPASRSGGRGQDEEDASHVPGGRVSPAPSEDSAEGSIATPVYHMNGLISSDSEPDDPVEGTPDSATLTEEEAAPCAALGEPPSTPFPSVSTQVHRTLSEGHTRRTSPCGGIRIPWPVGNAYTTYPFAIHAEDSAVGFQVCGIEDEGKLLVIRADGCLDVAAGAALACMRCTTVPTSRNWSGIVARATVLSKYTPYAYRSHAQMRDVAGTLTSEVKKLRLKELNDIRRRGTCIERLDDYKRFSMAIATMDVPRLRQLVAVSIRRGASAEAIVARMRDAENGLVKLTYRGAQSVAPFPQVLWSGLY
ncbi:uncharacterized protein TRAVEDRAFT_45797 [Trametes versicolor FP-101664 SS1]|uniref:uncharacterized protein n=1 Tax=Trametes versicolor (strain FP-101664) TaxID=717944 RepID=UPI0004623159|nr:uncharacterized protein TRAVEDRAFT_45797 [Trametes versicolor FP-101664 SS1]EIW60547.1 hypothetical protein TRAVEDRAFT_45797 [Trametes versicolor FP-101664 SS1]